MICLGDKLFEEKLEFKKNPSDLVMEYKELKKKERLLEREYKLAPDYQKEWRIRDLEDVRKKAKAVWSRICKGER